MSILSALGFDTKRITNESLKRLNLVAAVAHSIQGVVVLLLSNLSYGNEPITAGYLTKDTLASDGAGETILINATRHLFDLNLEYLLAAMFFISALYHLLSATRWRKAYEFSLKNGVNGLRWIEYGLSMGLLLLVVSLLVGISDIALLLLAFSSILVMGSLAYLREKSNQASKNVSSLNYWTGVTIGALPLVAILLYMVASLIWGNGLSTVTYFIFASLALLLAGFALNMYLQDQKAGRWKNYLFGERTYIVLSLIAKSVLAWQIFMDTLRP